MTAAKRWEYAARCVIEYGEPSGAWVLNQARNPGIGPRVLWALIDQQRRRDSREGQVIAHDRTLTREYSRLSAKRFRDGCRDDVESLQYWGQLWLSLEAIDEAEVTANKFMAVLDRRHDHDYRIIVLKLLALVHAERPLDARSTGTLRFTLSSTVARGIHARKGAIVRRSTTC